MTQQQLTTGSLELIVWSFLHSELEFEWAEQSPAAPAGPWWLIFATGGPAAVARHQNEGRCFTAVLNLFCPLGLLEPLPLLVRESLLPKAQVLLGDGSTPLREDGAAEKVLSRTHLASESSCTVSMSQQVTSGGWSLERRLNTGKSFSWGWGNPSSASPRGF